MSASSPDRLVDHQKGGLNDPVVIQMPEPPRLRRSGHPLLVALVVAPLLLSCVGGLSPRALDGAMDLSGHGFPASGPSIALAGEWSVVWHQLLAPESLDAPGYRRDGVHAIPGVWNEAVFQGREIGSTGCATFSLDVRVPDSLDDLALDIPDALTASRLFANGKLVAENGQPATSREATLARAVNRPHPLLVRASAGRLRLVYQIANHEADEGGAIHAPRLGRLESLERESLFRTAKESFLVGVLFLLGLYHLFLFAMRRDDRTLVPLALVCLLWAFRFFVEEGSGHRPITLLWPDLPFAALARMEVIPFYLTFPLLLHFFAAFFPGTLHKTVLRVAFAISAALVLVVLATPPLVFGPLLPLGGLLALVYTFLMVGVFHKAIRERCEGSLLLAAGCGAFAICGLSDLVQATGLAATGYHLDWGAFALACSNSAVVARRYSHAFLAMRRQAEELRRLDRVKDDFLANTSHELRTPLHGIIGIAESVRARETSRLPEEVRGDLDAIVASASRLARLVDDILDFSKLRHGDIVPHRQPVSLVESLQRVLPHFRSAVARKDLVLRSEVPPGLPAVLADPGRVDQILFNLVGNAVKFTDRGEIVVAVRVRDDLAELEVRDTGAGISAADRERIFEAFEQGSGSDRGGTGLGLSITRHLVELQGGSIVLESEPGIGSVFRISLPLAPEGIVPAPSIVPAYKNTSDAIETPSRSSVLRADAATILAVDDEPLNLRILRNHLEAEGHRVVCLDGGSDILAHIARERPSLVLLDAMMPGKDGFETCAEIRTIHPASDLPVVFVTARNRMDDLLRGYSVGGDDYIPKPFLREELLARVALHLGRGRTTVQVDESIAAGEIMRCVLDLWNDLTQTGRAEFAERSGIWNVKMDADGWRRTQTLDKYLDPRKTPKQPRWQKVQESARYVLDLAERDGRGIEKADELRRRLDGLDRNPLADPSA